jgi:hypothetical protein
MKTLNIGKDFSKDPAGRFRSDGQGNGEAFREDFLKNAILSLNAGEKLKIIIDDGVEGYGSSFLTEGFAGMVKYGYIAGDELIEKIEIIYTDEDFEFYKVKIIEYIKQARFNSETYEPNI